MGQSIGTLMEPDYRDLPQDPPHIPYPRPRTFRVITQRSGPVAYRGGDEVLYK
jgi:hypothetical protein